VYYKANYGNGLPKALFYTTLRLKSEMASSDDKLDDFQICFQEAHGSRLFRQGKPRALLEVKSPNIPTVIYEARLRGYDRAKTTKESPGS
jgi:hypothetical protein